MRLPAPGLLFGLLLAPFSGAAQPAAPPAAPTVAEGPGCNSEELKEARGDVRIQVGLPETAYTPVEPTPEQQRALIAGFEELVAKCPRNAELRLELFFVLDGDPSTSADRLLAAAEAVSTTQRAQSGKTFSFRPAQMLVAQQLLDRKLAPELVGRLLAESREAFASARSRLVSSPGEDPKAQQRRNQILDGTAALIDVLEARLLLRKGDAAAAGPKLAVAREILSATGPVNAGPVAQQFEVARQELAAAAPGAAVPAGLDLAPDPEMAEAGLFQDADAAFDGLPLEDVAGKTWALQDLAGKTWLVNLWATWCGPCLAELPHIQKLYDELKDRPDVGLLTLNFDQDPKRVAPYLAKRGYTFPVLLTAKKLEEHVRQGIPQNWLVDRGGKIRRKATGFDPEHPEAFALEVKKELEQLKAK